MRRVSIALFSRYKTLNSFHFRNSSSQLSSAVGDGQYRTSSVTPSSMSPAMLGKSENFNLFVEKPTRVSSRGRKNEKMRQLEEAFESAKTSDEMLAAFKKMEDEFSERRLGLALLKLGLQLDKEGENPEKALSFATRALNAFGEDCKKPNLSVAMALQLMGSVNFSLKNFKESLGYLNRADKVISDLEEEEEEEGVSKGQVQAVLHGVHQVMANVKTALGRREEALENLKKCLEIKEMMLGKNSCEVGKANRDLAEVYAGALNLKQALPYCLKALQIHELQLGVDSVEVAHDRRLLGVIYTGLEMHEEALKQNQLARKVLKNSGVGSDMLQAGIDAANMQIGIGKYDQAVKTLKIVVQRTDEDSEMRASVFISMGKALCNLEKFRDAKRCLEIARGILEKKEKEELADVSKSYVEIAMQYETMNEIETAIKLLQRTLNMLEKLPQEQHSLASTSARIGHLLMLTGKVSQAIPYLESAVEIMTECFGSSHYSVAYIYSNLGSAYLELGNHQLAVKMFGMAKSIMDVAVGPQHMDTIEACQNIAKAYSAMGSYDTAIKMQQQAIDAYERHGPNAEDDLAEAKQILEDLKKKPQCGVPNMKALPKP
ncbi:unnamed protein product [Rhodiola kirilowii]